MGRVVVLGATGMLGSAVFALAESRGVEVVGTTTDLRHASDRFARALIEFRGEYSELESIVQDLTPGDFVINCVGLIKHHIDDFSLESRLRAIALNAVLPHQLDSLAQVKGFKVIQIATDCVFSGTHGMYSEAAPHDAGDVYGQTKSLGEVPSSQFMHLRASIIGRELRTHLSLIDWALRQSEGANVTGYTDHYWNGVTTDAFARVALGLIAGGTWVSGTFHLTPADAVSKFDLLRIAYREFGRNDVRLQPTQTQRPVDRTLASRDPHWNAALWEAGGYASPPTIEQMVRDLAQTRGAEQ